MRDVYHARVVAVHLYFKGVRYFTSKYLDSVMQWSFAEKGRGAQLTALRVVLSSSRLICLNCDMILIAKLVIALLTGAIIITAL